MELTRGPLWSLTVVDYIQSGRSCLPVCLLHVHLQEMTIGFGSLGLGFLRTTTVYDASLLAVAGFTGHVHPGTLDVRVPSDA